MKRIIADFLVLLQGTKSSFDTIWQFLLLLFSTLTIYALVIFKYILLPIGNVLIKVTKHGHIIVEIIRQKLAGKYIDDRVLLMEKLMGIVATLPENSYARKRITDGVIKKLWDSLLHPPLSYFGPKYQYRQPDGSYNSILLPDLGKAGTPYARAVTTEAVQNGARPDPGLIFDLLMSRGDTFEENPAGISSMLLYHAAIITHDIFKTDRHDVTINRASSYLDLSPLYGSSQEELVKMRTGLDGQLKPDAFSDRRLNIFPPGAAVMLVMYNRFHNYAAKILAEINEGGRFTPPPHLLGEAALRWRDEHLFQVARLITNGLYVNISLHDYLRAIANIPVTDSNWTLDPRVEIEGIFDKRVATPGLGNHVSCEFNLLYRFHSATSDRDAKWIRELYSKLFSGRDPCKIPLSELLSALAKFEQDTPGDPEKRTFGNLVRGSNGRFNDNDLVAILKESIEDPAGRFGANHVPDFFKPVEILGILQARKWNVASLNEFRKFFKLKPYKNFEEINPDPYVADTLKRLYEHPDNVEMYPGMFLEAAKPRMDPAMGLCGTYTVTRAVFSDAITLVRGDRFLTVDYNSANLTNWGVTEVASDKQILGGAKMHHLILNAFPRHFKFNSVYAMQPFYTPTENRKIFAKLEVAHLYSFDPPTEVPPPIPIVSISAAKAILNDKENFKVPWGPKMGPLETYMLAADTLAAASQRQFVQNNIFRGKAMENFIAYTDEVTKKLLQRESYMLGRNSVYEVDIVKRVSNLVWLYFAADLCYLPLLNNCVNSGISYTESELHKVLCDLTLYVFSDADPTKSWVRRRDGLQQTEKLVAEMTTIVKSIRSAGGRPVQKPLILGLLEKGKCITRLYYTDSRIDHATSKIQPLNIDSAHLRNYGMNLVKKLINAGKTDREAAEILVGTASAIVANSATAFAQLLDFYLEPENARHWTEIQRLASAETPGADNCLAKYVLEGMRLSNSLGITRIVEPVRGESITITSFDRNLELKDKARVFVDFMAASRDPTVFTEPLEIRLDRPRDSYINFGFGPHQCLGKDANIVMSCTMLKVIAAGLEGLRRSPGPEGKLNHITKSLYSSSLWSYLSPYPASKPGGLKLYLSSDWSQLSPYPASLKVMWDKPPPKHSKTQTTSEPVAGPHGEAIGKFVREKLGNYYSTNHWRVQKVAAETAEKGDELAAKYGISHSMLSHLAIVDLHDFTILADDSGSMRYGNRIAALTDAVLRFYEIATAVNPSTKFSLRFFGHTDVGIASEDELRQNLAACRFDTGNEPADAIEIILNQLVQKARDRQLEAPAKVIVITDGDDHQSARAIVQAIENFIAAQEDGGYKGSSLKMLFCQVEKDQGFISYFNQSASVRGTLYGYEFNSAEEVAERQDNKYTGRLLETLIRTFREDEQS